MFCILEYSDNLSSLGTPGTRQTLYLSGEENVSSFYFYFYLFIVLAALVISLTVTNTLITI